MARLRWLIAVNAAVAAVLILIHSRFDAPALPSSAPDLPDALRDRTSIPVSVEYDDELLKEHREDAEDFIGRTFALVNLEWQRYRREWFRVDDVRLRASDGELDATHVLGTFLLRTAETPSTIHVCIVGRQLEVYSDGRGAALVGGLAFRRSDALVVSSPPGVTVELLAYYLFHAQHYWRANDALRSGDETMAARELDAMLEMPDDHPNARMLVGAVQRKIRKTTR